MCINKGIVFDIIILYIFLKVHGSAAIIFSTSACDDHFHFNLQLWVGLGESWFQYIIIVGGAKLHGRRGKGQL